MRFRKQNLSPKQRLKKRIHGYRTLGLNWTYMMETDFKGIFSPMFIKKEMQGDKDYDKLIEACSEEECQELNVRLDCYQIDKKFL